MGLQFLCTSQGVILIPISQQGEDSKSVFVSSIISLIIPFFIEMGVSFGSILLMYITFPSAGLTISFSFAVTFLIGVRQKRIIVTV